ncbi:hypothetical protein TNIN_357101 [Trichonephila inaurata madagascariensis]|uniref:Uncharacterized protein n=1 Tax=Trichonephila inaurata madagascariensis TaxID=2747483 RepID=A0A8X6MA06_9ARAC|nr:hypothetical protein TNIN_357101 [Trichonephila inaurata madagascariensis]
MDLNFDTLLDMEPRTPTRPSTPTPTKICSQLQQLAKEVDQYSTFVKGQQLYSSQICPQAVSEYSLSPFLGIDGCPHHDFPASTPIITISDTQDNSNDFIMETKNSHPTKRKEKSDGFTRPPSRKISKFNDIQPNFQIDLANKFNTLSQETAENNLTRLVQLSNTKSTSTPKKHLKCSTATKHSRSAPTPNYVPPPIMLKVTDTYKQQMKIITDKLPSTHGKLTGEYLKLYTNTNELHRQLIHILET